MSLTLREGSSTPWGRAQSARELIPGLWVVDTAGHGGIKLDRARHAKLPEACRREGGWFEEDCEASIPIAFYLDEIKAAAQAAGKEWASLTHDSLVASLARWERKALAALVDEGKVRMTDEARKIVADEEASAARWAAAKASGKPLRRSAMSAGEERVHVLFEGPSGTEGRYMATATYHAIPLLEPATPEDFGAHGAVEPAPADFVREPAGPQRHKEGV